MRRLINDSPCEAAAKRVMTECNSDRLYSETDIAVHSLSGIQYGSVYH